MTNILATLLILAVVALGMQSLAHISVIDSITTIAAQIGR